MVTNLLLYLQIKLGNPKNEYMRLFHRIIILINVWLFLASFCPSQSSSILGDSLLSVWQDERQHDSTRIDAYFTLVDSLKIFNVDSLEARGKTLVSFGQEQGTPKTQAEGLQLQGIIWYHKKEYKKAIDYFGNALKLRQQQGNQADIASIYYNSGLSHRALDEHEIALDYFKKALKIDRSRGHLKRVSYDLAKAGHSCESMGRYEEALTFHYEVLEIDQKLQDKTLIAWDYHDIASIYLPQGKYSKAISYLEKSLQLFQSLGNKYGIAKIYTQFGRIYSAQGLLTEALDYHQKSLQLNKELNNSRRVADQLNNLGIVKGKQGDTLGRLDYLQQSLAIREAMNDDWGRGYALNNIGVTYRQLGQYDSAHYYLGKALEVRERIGYKKGISGTSQNIAYLYSLQGNYPMAVKYGSRALQLAEEMKSHSFQSRACAELYYAYKDMGNASKALYYHEKWRDLRDSIKNNDIVVQLQSLEFEKKILEDSLQNEQARLARELEFQQTISQQKNHRNIIVGLGIGILLIAIGLYHRLRFVKKTEATLKEKNHQIEVEKEKAQASEQAKHQFLANMSHEIRTPMNAIKGMTDILLRRAPQSEQLTYLKAIKESSNSLLVIINDILDISKIEAGKVELEKVPFSIEEVIQHISMITQFKAEEKGLSLQTNLANNSHFDVIGDPTRLHQVLLNLVGNAIKFTEKGMITIQLKTEVLEKEHKVLAHFCVSDTGVGIGADRLEKIFESFEQAYSDTTRKFGGTGLGLSISKKLVELQGGKIWAESIKGKGSKFHFTIPYAIAEQTTEVAAVSEQIIGNTSLLKDIRVLLVEDNHFNAIVAQEELEDAIEGAVVEVAENGVIAVEKASHGDFDVILMDIQMPVMNGYEATNAIRNLSNEKSQIPIIAMTANVMKEEVDRCYEAGMDDFIGKAV
jgi:signal transduction histidine kinase/CheY-like chemotaxis protein/Flp pilus assembly protein TadD